MSEYPEGGELEDKQILPHSPDESDVADSNLEHESSEWRDNPPQIDNNRDL